MFAFLLIPIIAVLLLYLNIRRVAAGNRGAIIAGAFIVLPFLSFFLARHDSVFFSWLQTFMVVWLCQAFWMFILFDMIYLGRFIFRKFVRTQNTNDTQKSYFICNCSRIVLAASILLTACFLAYGIPHNDNYRTYTLNVASGNQPASAAQGPAAFELPRRGFSAVFFSDLHVDPLFKMEKLDRLIAECDSLKPDFVLFGGDLADVMDSTMEADDYGPQFQKLAATARVGAIAINGNHEAFMEGSGSDPEGFLRKYGWTVLDDSSACFPEGGASRPVACFTGRMDFQVSRARDVPRKPLEDLVPTLYKNGAYKNGAYKYGVDTNGTASKIDAVPCPDGSECIESNNIGADVPWILMDHQPKGIEPGYSGKLPDLALSGHTHDGQFFPVTALIGLFWRIAYGEGVLDGVHWLVSSGIDSWGPPVRVGSGTEIWHIIFK